MDIDILFVIAILMLFNVKTIIFGLLLIAIAYFIKVRRPLHKKKKKIDCMLEE